MPDPRGRGRRVRWRTRKPAKRTLTRAVAAGTVVGLIRHALPRPRRRTWWLAASVGMTAIVTGGLTTQSTRAAADGSAIGNATVSWIAVSPVYTKTGLVLAVASTSQGCSQNCQRLWVSHDGGGSWRQARAAGWNGGAPMIAVDALDHDVLYAGGTSVERSNDGGDSWATVGGGGSPTPAPTYHTNGVVAVAAPQNHDYVLSARGTEPVPGSGGGLSDASFMYAPSFPNGGGRAPALLGGLDPRSGLPAVARCEANLRCTGSTPLPGATSFSGPPTLLPSSAYIDDGAVFAQTASGIYKSADGGLTFTSVPVGAQGAKATATPSMALEPGYTEHGPIRSVYVGVIQLFTERTAPRVGGGLYHSSDAGQTWQALDPQGPFSAGATAVAVAPDGRLFAGYSGGLLCRTASGQTWDRTCPPVGMGGPRSGAGSQPMRGSGTQASGGAQGHAATTMGAADSGEAGSTVLPSRSSLARSTTRQDEEHWALVHWFLVVPVVLVAIWLVVAATRRRLNRRR